MLIASLFAKKKKAEQKRMLNLNIWGRSVEVEVVYDVRCGEKVSREQQYALERFLSDSERIFSIAEEKAKDYCLGVNGEDVGEKTISNIFKYVVPKAILVNRSEGVRTVALLCHYKFNMDDGLAIVFENEAFSQIGSEDIIL